MKKTLRKPDKLRFKSEFDHVRNHGVKLVGRKMLAVYAPAPDGHLRCGVVCGRKYNLLAVKRNRARRLLWESFRLLKPEIPVCHLILIPRKYMADAKMPDVEAEMAFLIRKIPASAQPTKNERRKETEMLSAGAGPASQRES